MFANTQLARRIEAAESKLVVGLARAAAVGGHDVLIAPLGGGFAIHGGEGAPYNKVVGAGFEALDEAALAHVEAQHDARRATLRFEVATVCEPAFFEALSRRGYALSGFENVLGRALVPGQPLALVEGVDVRPTRPEESEAWMETLIDGFAAPDGSAAQAESFPREALESVFRLTEGVDVLERFLALRSDAIVGAAALYRYADTAILGGAATLPAHRRQGIQRALLHGRLTRAAEEGCSLAIVTTQPGSQSQANVTRAGFALLYARAVLVRAPR